ncbi:hypothetical protein [Micromonospora sp. CPCC 206061]|uniref:hypothetical protein n=1 Tax=Micromonospora sp. CPCC 206061 TaxID=3122410 RepID=UPI002FF40369
MNEGLDAMATMPSATCWQRRSTASSTDRRSGVWTFETAARATSRMIERGR